MSYQRVFDKAISLGFDSNSIECKTLLSSFVFAERKHRGQVDKQGKKYILHPLSVMEMAKTIDEAIVGILHDVLEDTDATEEDLYHLGLSKEIVDAVVSLSRKDGEIYINDFIHRVNENPLGRIVKIYDIKHNLSRISGLPKEEQGIYKRYERALKILEG